MKESADQGILLHKYPVGENDLIATWYTRNHGMIKTKVRGAKKLTGRFTGHLEYFNLCHLNLHNSKNRLILTDCLCEQSFSAIKSNLDKLNLSAQLINLIKNLSYENESIQDLFQLMIQTLQIIEHSSKTEFLIEVFKSKLLDLIGLLPNFDHCCFCEKATQENDQLQLTTLGSFCCSNCAQKTNHTYETNFQNIKLLKFLATRNFADIQKITLSPDQLQNYQNFLAKLYDIHELSPQAKNYSAS